MQRLLVLLLAAPLALALLILSGSGATPGASVEVVQRGTGAGPPAPAPVQLAGLADPKDMMTPVATAPDQAPVEVAGRARAIRVATRRVQGSVVTPGGDVLSGVAVRLATDPEGTSRARTDGAGRFSIQVPSRPGEIVVADAGYATVQPARLRNRGPATIVAAPAGDRVVEVWDGQTGAPLVAARVALTFAAAGEADPGTEAGPGAGESRRSLHWANTDSTGRARLERVPVDASLEWSVSRPGYHSARLALDIESGISPGFALQPRTPASMFRGTVRDTEGTPVHGAELALGAARSWSAADGTFHIAMVAGSNGAVLHAFHPDSGTASARVDDPGSPLDVTLSGHPPGRRLRLSRGPAPEAEVLRLVPLGPDGGPDPFVPHWQSANVSADGSFDRPALPNGTVMVAVTKDGKTRGRVTLDGSGAATAELRAER